MALRYLIVAILAALLGGTAVTMLKPQQKQTSYENVPSYSASSCEAVDFESHSTALNAYKNASPEVATWNLKERLYFLDRIRRGECKDLFDETKFSEQKLITTLRLMRSYKIGGKGPQSEQAMQEAVEIARDKLGFSADNLNNTALFGYLAEKDGRQTPATEIPTTESSTEVMDTEGEVEAEPITASQ